MWTLHYEGKNELAVDVQRGSYKVLDNGELFEKLKKYVTKFGDTKKLNPIAYSRNPTKNLSSHYKDSPEQYGIDMRINPAGEAKAYLPNDHRHLLFGSIPEEAGKKALGGHRATFIKFEHNGIGTWEDYGHHTCSYLQSIIAPPNPGNTQREKDIPKSVKDGFVELIKEASSKGISCPQSRNHQIVTIATIHRDTQHILATASEKLTTQEQQHLRLSLDKFFNTIANANLKGGALHARTGNEVIIDRKK